MLKAHIVSDESFYVNVEPALVHTDKHLHSLVKWFSEGKNKTYLQKIVKLKKFIPDIPAKNTTVLHSQRIDVCKKYHHLRCSSDCSSKWRSFM